METLWTILGILVIFTSGGAAGWFLRAHRYPHTHGAAIRLRAAATALRMGDTFGMRADAMRTALQLLEGVRRGG